MFAASILLNIYINPFSSTDQSRVEWQANTFTAIEIASINTHAAPKSF